MSNPASSNHFHDDLVKVVLAWHRRLHPNESGHSPGDKASRAQLARCGHMVQILGYPAAHQLIREAREIGASSERFDQRLLTLAALLADIKPSNGGQPLARLIGCKTAGKADGADLKPHRFHALLKALSDPENRNDTSVEEARLTALRRAVKMAGGSGINVGRLVEDLLFWDDRRVSRWSYDYWNTPIYTQAA